MNYTQFLTWPGATVVPFESCLGGRRRAWSIRIRDPHQGAAASVAKISRGLQTFTIPDFDPGSEP